MTTEEINLVCRDYIAAQPEENKKCGKAMLQELSANEVLVENAPVKGLYVQKVFSGKAIEILKNAGEMTASIGAKAIRFYRENKDFRKAFSFSPELEELVLIDPGYQTLLPILRADVFYNERTGDFRFCELNTDGTSGMTEDRELGRAFSSTVLCGKLQTMFELRSYELFDSLTGRYMEIYRETKNPKETPTVAVVDFTEYASSMDEFGAYRRSFERQGAKALVTDIRKLSFDGKHLLAEDGTVIDAVYRRAVTSDLLSHPEEAKALTAAYKAHAVVLLGGFCTQVVHDKAFFTAVTGPLAAEFLDEREREFLRKHLPVTRILNQAAVRECNPSASRAGWVLKPRSSYGSRGICIGKDMEQKEWDRALAASLAEGTYLLQEYVEPFRSFNINYAEQEPVLKEYYNTTGIYLFGGKFSGIYSRISESRIITTARGGFNLSTMAAVSRPAADSF